MDCLNKQPASGSLHFSQHLQGDSCDIMRKACEMGFEGIVSKRIEPPYRSGRVGDWTKAKCYLADPFVIIGYVPSAAALDAVGSLLLGYYRSGGLVFAGRVGSGLTAMEARAVWQGLTLIGTKPPPLSRHLTKQQLEGVRWVAPLLVAQVSYGGWTGDGLLRHATLKGLRDDKRPEEIRRPISFPEL